ncbi:hypothetical protein AVEN_187172-1 [Araneus ventricosus]|uniref:Uncharacterized protein n=1 Tax=Araneus ventricosus TaxID=182803 RepID=A0A4Y2CWT0_ARAVE|nr:hypothetical protein AVEN_187172-1 [Araneus ventricosus]
MLTPAKTANTLPSAALGQLTRRPNQIPLVWVHLVYTPTTRRIAQANISRGNWRTPFSTLHGCRESIGEGCRADDPDFDWMSEGCRIARQNIIPALQADSMDSEF